MVDILFLMSWKGCSINKYIAVAKIIIAKIEIMLFDIIIWNSVKYPYAIKLNFGKNQNINISWNKYAEYETWAIG